MRFSDYITGQRFTLVSRMPPEEVEARINAATRSILNPFGQGVLGWAGFGQMRLVFVRRRFYRHQWEPVLAGRIRQTSYESHLDLNYRAPLWFYFFMPIWYLGLAGIVLSMAIGGAPFMAVLLLLGLGSFSIMPVLVYTRDELQALLAFLRSEIGAAAVGCS
jgi:hypothetical protein